MSWLASPTGYVVVATLGALLWLVFAWLHLRFWVARLALPLDYSHYERIQTPDGAAFELRRIEPHATSSDRPPVLMVHGICANHRNQDIHPRYSLARHLSAQGRDVWLVTLRSGLPESGRLTFRPMGFADMVRHDLPMAVARTLELTGARQIDYVAFSMGGMLLFASIGRTIPEASIRKAVFVGSPARVLPPHPYVGAALRYYPRWLVPPIWSGLGGRLFAFLSEWFTTPLHRWVLNPANMPVSVTRLALVECVQDVPAALASDFLGWMTNGGDVRMDGHRVIESLGGLGVPALFVAGTADRLGVASAVREGYEAWAKDRPATRKSFLLLGRGHRADHDYGHGDLAMGRNVEAELYQPVARFLEGPSQVEDESLPDRPNPPS